MTPALVELRLFNQELDAVRANAITMDMVEKMLSDRGIFDEEKEEETGWCLQCSGSGEG